MIKFIKKNSLIRNFNKLNEKIFKSDHKKNNGIVLVEFNAFQNLHTNLSYLSNYFSNYFSAKIFAYYNYSLVSSPLKQSFLNKVKRTLGIFLNIKTYSIYKSFNVEKFVYPNFSSQIKDKAEFKFKEIKKNLLENEDILNIEIENIKLGTLIYDGYKIYNKTPYIELDNESFDLFLKDFIELFYFWYNFFKNENVKCIVGCHAVYAYGIPMRIAISFNTPTFAVEDGLVFSLTKTNLYQNAEFKYYKKIFSHFTENQKLKARKLALKLLQNRFDGKVGIDIKESRIPVSSFANEFNKNDKIFKNNGKLNVVIFTHEINDAANGNGKGLYPDYYEWLKEIINLSKKTDYNWYVKDHPNYHGKFTPGQKRTVTTTKELIKTNPEIIYLPSSTSHHQIINEKVDFVMTVNSDITYEYAYHNIPVLTGSKNCPTYDYDFNIHSSSKKEFEDKVKNLKNIKIDIDRNQVLEFYFMASVYRSHDMFTNYAFSDFLKKNENWEALFSDKIYDFFVRNWNEVNHKKKLKCIENFFKSGNYYLDYKHAEITIDQLIDIENLQ